MRLPKTSPMRNKPARLVLDSFIPYRLSVLTNLVSSAIAGHYSERFDLSIPEWRIIAVLGENAGLSARDVATRTAMDKVQVSRAVASLLKAQRIRRSSDARDGRVSHLSLTRAGRKIYQDIAPLALNLEALLLSSLTAKERENFSRLLTKLTQQSPKLRSSC
jgi:DNA-binding MarR family transcriptional regulator